MGRPIAIQLAVRGATMAHSGHRDCKQRHFLNEQIDEWRVLQSVQGIFSRKIEWRVRPGSGHANSDGRAIQLENGYDFFITALGILPVLAPVQALSCEDIDDCINTLTDVLNLLNDLVEDRVLDADVEDTLTEKQYCKAKTTQDESDVFPIEEEPSRGSRLVNPILSVLSWLGLGHNESNLPSTESLPPNTPSRPASRTPTLDIAKYPKLRALGEIFESGLQYDIESAGVMDLCVGYLVLEQTADVYQDASEKLESFFTVWADLRQLNVSDSRDLFPLSIPATNWEDQRPAEFACQLFKALNARVCTSLDSATQKKVEHTILLQLNGFQFEGEGSVTFDVFFSCGQHGHWQQSRFFSRGKPRHFGSQRERLPRLCEALYDQDGIIISISVQQSGGGNLLVAHRKEVGTYVSNPPTMPLEGHLSQQSSRQPATLGSLGSDDTDSFGLEDKADLALSLARCLLHLFESPWVDWPWTASSIQFLHHTVSDEILDLRRPYVLGMLHMDTADDGELEAKCQKALISFARLLLEIETRQLIALDAKSQATQLYNILTKTSVFRERPKFHLAIDSCLKFGPALAREKKLKPKWEPNRRIRKVIYTTIIRPLEENLSQYQHARTRRAQYPRAQGTESTPAHINKSRVREKYTDKWFRGFLKLLIKYDIGRLPPEQRLKVAILDSGINYQHLDFTNEDRRRIKGRKSFIGGDVDVDKFGHGTHIAAIILRLTKNVDLYIGQITDSDRVSQREVVVEAMKHARTEWGVDIMNLSFGFEGDPPEPDEMGQEIKDCLHNGITMFASASNDGGESPRTYPAKYPGVVCVHATDWKGDASSCWFNPAPDRFSENFSVVGKDIRPTWPKKPRDTTMKYRNGTSFATPVAVAFAAFMIGYIQIQCPDRRWITRPRSPEGITTIFRVMMERKGDYDWISPTRYLALNKRVTIEGQLVDRLMSREP
ncbi:hypothetical protein CDV31_011492 [Fusarium ambrosium]|uniref:Uncharacterized protein n=1 Tax=Fusarium ambrosium TaxID=131363 RepID=A0A428TGH5_9HYPO|nr:hypothetical protein CDV31_011492 [Fusarium ambrosium]